MTESLRIRWEFMTQEKQLNRGKVKRAEMTQEEGEQSREQLM